MNQHPLRTPLEHLQTELDRVPPPEATDPLLEEVRHVTTELLTQTTTSPTVAPHPSFREQLGTAMDRFEVLHPTLAAAIAQVIDTPQPDGYLAPVRNALAPDLGIRWLLARATPKHEFVSLPCPLCRVSSSTRPIKALRPCGPSLRFACLGL